MSARNRLATNVNRVAANVPYYAKAVAANAPKIGKPAGASLTTTLPQKVISRKINVDPQRLSEFNELTKLRNRDTIPLSYPYILAFGTQMEMMTAPDFPIRVMGSIHLGSSISFHRPVYVGEELTLNLACGEVSDHRRGVVFDIRSTLTENNSIVVDQTSSFLVQTKKPSGPRVSRVTVPVAPDFSVRADGSTIREFAMLTGDLNPIHLSPLTAKLFGFPTSIAHGAWTASAQLQDEPVYDKPVTYSFSFAKPLLLPGRMGVNTANIGGGRQLVARNPKNGEVYVNGRIDFI